MKKIISLMILLVALSPLALAQKDSGGSTTTASSTVNTGATASPILNFATPDPSTGRLFSNPVQPFESPVLPYFGPWTTGSNILDDLRTVPQNLTAQVAKKMYNGGVKVRVNYVFDTAARGGYPKLSNQVTVLFSLPSKPLLKDGKQAVNEKNQPLYVLDETRFYRVAYIFLQGNNHATTADVIAEAAIYAMKLGANGIFVVKKVTATGVSASGWGIGAGAVNGVLAGTNLDHAQSYSAGTGYNHATTKPTYGEGMVVLAVLE